MPGVIKDGGHEFGSKCVHTITFGQHSIQMWLFEPANLII